MKIDMKKYLPLAEAIFSSCAIMLKENIRVTNMLSLFLITSLYAFYRHYDFACNNGRIKKVTIGTSAFLAFLITLLGTQSIHEYALSNLQKVIVLAIIFMGMLLLVYRVLLLLYSARGGGKYLRQSLL